MASQRHLTQWKSRSLVCWLVTALSIVTMGAGTANASAPSPTREEFARQAAAAGLSPAQARRLQARVDGYLENLGGVQDAANQIRLDGATLTLTLPGEERVRSLTGSILAPGCSYRYLCAWKYQDYTGDRINYYYCTTVSMPWATFGSFRNNQTYGTVTRFIDINHVAFDYSESPEDDPNYYWAPVYWIDVC